MRQRTIYVALLDEGVDVWRPVEAEELRDSVYRIISENPNAEDERWEFPPRAIVRCEWRALSEGPCLVAVARAAVYSARCTQRRRRPLRVPSGVVSMARGCRG
jgi:hypothetical protein